MKVVSLLSLSPDILPDANKGEEYKNTDGSPVEIMASGVHPPFNWEKVSGNYPANIDGSISADSTKLTLAGNVIAPDGDYPIEIKVTDSKGNSVTKNY